MENVWDLLAISYALIMFHRAFLGKIDTKIVVVEEHKVYTPNVHINCGIPLNWLGNCVSLSTPSTFMWRKKYNFVRWRMLDLEIVLDAQ